MQSKVNKLITIRREKKKAPARGSVGVDKELLKRIEKCASLLGCSQAELADAIFSDAMPELEKKLAENI